MALEAVAVPRGLLPWIEEGTTGFLPLNEWAPFLDRHPDRQFAVFMHRGLSFGFRIGLDRSRPLGCPLQNLYVYALVGGALEAYGSRPVCVCVYVFRTCFSATAKR